MTQLRKLVSEETGEKYSIVAIKERLKFSGKGDEKFMLVFDRGLEYLNELDLSGVDNKVLRKLMTLMQYENWVQVNQSRVAEDLGIKHQNVSRSMKKLVGYGVIRKQKDPSDHRKYVYKLNEEIGWRGGKKDWASSLEFSKEKPLKQKLREPRDEMIMHSEVDTQTLKYGNELLCWIVDSFVESIVKSGDEIEGELELEGAEVETAMTEGMEDGEQLVIQFAPIEVEKDGRKYRSKAGEITITFVSPK